MGSVAHVATGGLHTRACKTDMLLLTSFVHPLRACTDTTGMSKSIICESRDRETYHYQVFDLLSSLDSTATAYPTQLWIRPLPGSEGDFPGRPAVCPDSEDCQTVSRVCLSVGACARCSHLPLRSRVMMTFWPVGRTLWPHSFPFRRNVLARGCGASSKTLRSGSLDHSAHNGEGVHHRTPVRMDIAVDVPLSGRARDQRL